MQRAELNPQPYGLVDSRAATPSALSAVGKPRPDSFRSVFAGIPSGRPNNPVHACHSTAVLQVEESRFCGLLKGMMVTWCSSSVTAQALLRRGYQVAM